MKTFRITEIGGSPITIEAANDYYAVAEAACCAVNDVTLPIWEESIPVWAPRGLRCYMPLDNTGRQWLVEDVKATA